MRDQNFIEPIDIHLDVAALQEKFGPFWTVANHRGPQRDVRTPNGRAELLFDMQQLYDQVLSIAGDMGIETTHVDSAENLLIPALSDERLIKYYTAYQTDPELDIARRAVGLLMEGERTTGVVDLVFAETPTNSHQEFIQGELVYPIMRAGIKTPNLRTILRLLDNPEAYRISDGVMVLHDPITASIQSGLSNVKLSHLFGAITIIQKQE